MRKGVLLQRYVSSVRTFLEASHDKTAEGDGRLKKAQQELEIIAKHIEENAKDLNDAALLNDCEVLKNFLATYPKQQQGSCLVM